MVYRYVCNGFLHQIRLGSYQLVLPVPGILRLCNYLQNAGATTYIFGLQLSTFLFYNKHTVLLSFYFHVFYPHIRIKACLITDKKMYIYFYSIVLLSLDNCLYISCFSFANGSSNGFISRKSNHNEKTSPISSPIVFM